MATEQRSVRIPEARPCIQTNESSVNERSYCTKQTLACQGAGLQRVQVIQEVTQDLIHKLLWKGLPSGAGESLGDVVDPSSYTAPCKPYPQVGGISYGNVSPVDRMGESLWLIFTRTVGGLHAAIRGGVGGMIVVGFDPTHHYGVEVSYEVGNKESDE